MADFSAVLRKTIHGLKENTPEMREKVYQKARATVDAKLAAVSPPPPPAVVERQKRLLEDAIAAVEADYSDADAVDTPAEGPDFLVTRPETPLPPASQDTDAVEAEADSAAYRWNEADASEPLSRGPEEDDAGEQAYREEERARWSATGGSASARGPRRGRTGLVVFLVLILIVVGGGYALWLNRDSFGGVPGLQQIVALVKGNGESTPATTGKSQQGTVKPAAKKASGESAKTATADNKKAATAKSAPAPTAQKKQAEPVAGEAEGAGSETGAQGTAKTAMANGANDDKPLASAKSANTPSTPKAPEKFTQRLTPEGGEVDAGPSGDKPTIGEGTSVASATEPPAETTAPATTGGQAAEQQAAGQDKAEQVPVGQRAIFYEERTNSAQGSAENGSIVWSLVQESPGNDLPPEPAIRGEATIPGKNLQLRITIRRNADKSLPASHIVEMIFLTPDDFKGGGIDNVLRIAMKKSEQDTGNPLLGIPAKIADGFFLFALNDTKAEEQTNLLLLRRQEWIDIPIVYKSGRRALMTMEKGVPGDKVFDEALDAWEKASSG